MTAYWIATYHDITDLERFREYAALGSRAVEAAGGRFLARSNPAHTYELEGEGRTVLIEFDSVQAAREAYESPAYSAAREVLGDGARRGLRIVPGIG